ncbi:hypothetical protein [Sphingomonas sp. LHG3443-2]|uniref:hypothetical protein n=1 Tax=Sphingomonas sp. LHG3443-2 TaxID=2804639 RepID=UPI003CEA5F12
MRLASIPLLLLISACQQEAPTTGPGARPESGAVTIYAGSGRDRLCLAEQGGTASFVTYAPSGDANCTVQGTWSPSGPSAIKPNEDPSCSIIFNREGQSVRLLAGGPGCAYYCGPGASFEGKTFVRMDKPEPVTDLAGDPLC